MRTLKKSLALVLVIALVLSIGAVGASAAFTDTASSNYGEAIQVMTGIKVIDGMTDTTFEPTSSLTREQAAKIIAFMLLGPTNAALISTASSAPFADVAADRWSAGYIQYAANLGIISGVGDNKFDPAGTLTTAAWTKMLLCALGYKSDAEGLEGDSWAINAATLAVGAGIADSSITLSAVTACTREQACQLAYNTLTANTVQYTGGTTIEIGGNKVITGATRSNVPNNSGSGYLTTGNDALMQFCEAKFPTLKQSVTTLNGAPSYTWKIGATVIGTYGSKAAVASWTDSHSNTALDSTVAKALSGYSYAASVAEYINGEPQSAITTGYAAAIAALTGNGVKVEVFATGTVIDTVVVTRTALAQIINKDTYNKTVTVAYSTYQVTLSDKSDTDLYGDAYTALYGMNVKDYVLLVSTVSGTTITGILSYATPNAAAGQFTASSAGAYTIGGTAYKAAAGFTPSFTLGNSYTLLLDTYGYIVAQDVDASATVYAYVIQGSRDGSAMAGYTYNAQLLFTDGTVKWVSISAYNGGTAESDLYAASQLADKFVAYTAQTDGSYALATTGLTQDAPTGTITTNSSSFNSKIVSNSTVFLVYNPITKTYASYTGIKNVPTTNVTTGVGLVSNGTAYSVVVVKASTTTSADVVYIYNTTATASEYVNGVAAYSFKAIVNGIIGTVKVNNATVTKGLKLGSTYTNGIITSVGTDTSTGLDSITSNKVFSKTPDANTTFNATLSADNVTLSDGILTVGGINSTYSATGIVGDSFVLYVVSASNQTVTIQSLSSTAFAATGTLNLVIDANGYVAYAILTVA